MQSSHCKIVSVSGLHVSEQTYWYTDWVYCYEDVCGGQTNYTYGIEFNDHVFLALSLS